MYTGRVLATELLTESNTQFPCSTKKIYIYASSFECNVGSETLDYRTGARVKAELHIFLLFPFNI